MYYVLFLSSIGNKDNNSMRKLIITQDLVSGRVLLVTKQKTKQNKTKKKPKKKKKKKAQRNKTTAKQTKKKQNKNKTK